MTHLDRHFDGCGVKANALCAFCAFIVLCCGARVGQSQQQPAAPPLAARVPLNVRQAIWDSVNASDRPTSDDLQGGFHEEGGIWITTSDGSAVVQPAVHGEYARPGHQAHLDITMPAHPVASDRAVSLGGAWHVHPAGETVNRRVLPVKREGRKEITTVILTTTMFDQPPSSKDMASADFPINIVVGARSKIVYFYNRSGILATMPLDEFLAPLHLSAARQAPEKH